MRVLLFLAMIFVVVFLGVIAAINVNDRLHSSSSSGDGGVVSVVNQNTSASSNPTQVAYSASAPTTTPLPPPAQPTPTPAPKQATVGVYTLNRKLDGENNWMDGSLTTIEVRQDETLKLTAVFRNNRASSVGVQCQDWTDIYILLDDSTRVAPTSTFCDGQESKSMGGDPGQELTTWFIFPALADASHAFTVQWIYINGYGYGSNIEGILLQ